MVQPDRLTRGVRQWRMHLDARHGAVDVGFCVGALFHRNLRAAHSILNLAISDERRTGHDLPASIGEGA